MDENVPCVLKLSLKLAQLAYQEEDGFKKGLDTIGVKHVDFLYINRTQFGRILTDTQVHVFVNPTSETCYVVYRGSKELKDFITDLDFHYEAILDGTEKNIKVHSGFLHQYEAVQTQLQEYLADVKRRQHYSRVVFCGHSLGAALATLTLVMFHEASKNWSDRKELFLYNFGSPRVGNKEFCDYFSQCCEPANHWRVFNNHDIVTKLLPRSFFTDKPYQHLNGNSLRLFSSADLNLDAMHYAVQETDRESLSCNDSAVFHECDHYMTCLLTLFPPTSDVESILHDALKAAVVPQPSPTNYYLTLVILFWTAGFVYLYARSDHA